MRILSRSRPQYLLFASVLVPNSAWVNTLQMSLPTTRRCSFWYFRSCLHDSLNLGAMTDLQHRSLQLFWVANAVFTMSNALVKLSLLSQYLRIFQNAPMRFACKSLMILVSIWGSSYSFIAWFPVRLAWFYLSQQQGQVINGILMSGHASNS